MARTRSQHRKEYHSKRPMRIFIIIVLIITILALGAYSLSVNSFRITFQEAIQVVINRINGIIPDRETDYIAWMIDWVVIEENAPRTVGALLIGTILAVSGAVMQTITRNPLAEPYTIGISSAALFGVTLSIALGVSIIPGVDEGLITGVNAFTMAMIPAMVIMGITTFKKLSPNMMILVGIGMMYLFSSITTLIKFNASEEALHEIYAWSLGTMSKIGWDDILPMTVMALVMIVVFTVLAGHINVLMSGDKVAQSLGVNPITLRLICFVMVSLGVAVAVYYTGTIGFVGLVAPHITRLFTGNNNKILIPVSALAGTLLILVGDVIVRMLPGGLPAGVITAMIGSPLFLFFLVKQRKNSSF